VQQLHRHEQRAVVGAAEIVDAYGVRTGQLRHDARFLLEAGDELLALGVFDDHELERDLLAGLRVLGGLHGPHRALADGAGQLEAPGDDIALAQLLGRLDGLGHGAARNSLWLWGAQDGFALARKRSDAPRKSGAGRIMSSVRGRRTGRKG
jgi:hypothetical protein